ncbi:MULTISPECIES: hypothetical protein [unclassified Streptomyces]|uniref:hypothetical protein n=1 Tax=unclassified Streptomyces TaxID=2593676 RepID=UPI0029AB3FB0|nr:MULTISPECIES: hypothetical protein [unclassified Streptomyces]MDX3772455.1 hypothetical protein [Streptomyces sp. AK08-01B]MDX3821957.1 hypothetical protein [Streptomyces sp. AK08-01A]
MHDRPRMEEALDLLRAELEVGRSTKTELTTRAAWLAFMRFGRQRFATALTPDSDGLLFQYGTYAFSGRPMFTVDLTRQFDISDDDGEHDHYVQVHCELRYECEPALDALGGFDSWFFHDADADLDQWLAAMEGHLELLLARGPSEIDVYEESV